MWYNQVMKRIPLTNGGYTLVDDADYEVFSAWNWQKGGTGHAVRCQYKSMLNGKSVNETIRLHKEINNTPKGFDTDHINRNKLDNRRSNLRTTTRSQNLHNRGKIMNGSKSSLEGAQWRKDRNKWRSYICIDYKDVYLGSYDSEIDAHLAYMSAKEQLVWS